MILPVPSSERLVTLTPSGLYVPSAIVHIDLWGPSIRAVMTRGHADHARGTASHLLSASRRALHPAGHILGSAQVRVEHRGEVPVVTGDGNRQEDPSAETLRELVFHDPGTRNTWALECRWDAIRAQILPRSGEFLPRP